MFKNKHVVLAMIVTPILALGGYFATDHLVSEKPRAALAGQSYKLVAKSNCRYESGRCTLENGDLRITIQAQDKLEVKGLSDGPLTLTLDSNTPLKGAKIALALPGIAPSGTTPRGNRPIDMTMLDADTSGTRWQATLHRPLSRTVATSQSQELQNTLLMLVVAIGESHYYAETGMAFIQYETAFSRDAWSGSTDAKE